ncbi:DUF3558 domain-containing protein [Haloechinothrix halophila]|uniref:DUF3558 domain-containing protein n=1 Tax=Haloechinothrix halophila TaxID=1069073 RepID=UPI0004003B51|nr:DUF3558 domain-containing protein [Haloechinothrix halophila]
MKLSTVSAAVAATALLLAGCSNGEAGEPTSNGETQPTVDVGPRTTTPQVSAPQVTDPIENLDKYNEDPCAMLTTQQAKKIGYAADIRRPPDQDNGPECEWRGKDSSNFTIVLLNKQPLGITGVYQNKSDLGYFEPVDINGYPGVFGGAIDNRDNGACALSVGVTDEQVINVGGRFHLGSPDRDRPCEVMKQAAEMALKTMSSVR